MKFSFTLSLLLLCLSVFGQSLCNSSESFKILHFTKTTGFDHNTRTASANMFEEIGIQNGFSIKNTEEADIFDELDSLLQFAVIIFSNTSGNQLFTDNQQANFESYINQGGNYIGIHAATDTYRTGWPFYNDLVGAIVQSGPNHTNQNHVNFMDHTIAHEILDGVPDPWEKEEEYYYWDLNGGMIDTSSISTLLKVRQTGIESYDRERPITWFKILPSGARSFYTALGHKKSNFEVPENTFRTLISNAVCWTAYDHNTTSSFNTRGSTEIKIYPNPGNTIINISSDIIGAKGLELEIINSMGKVLYSQEFVFPQIDVSNLISGQYFIRILDGGKVVKVKGWVKE